jgi:hypothetical protein
MGLSQIAGEAWLLFTGERSGLYAVELPCEPS